MARKAMIAKDQNRKKIIEKYREKRAELRKVMKSATASPEEKAEARSKMDKLPRRSIEVRSRNRCKLTGRSRGYLRKFGMSRIAFRENVLAGYIPGVTKSSW